MTVNRLTAAALLLALAMGAVGCAADPGTVPADDTVVASEPEAAAPEVPAEPEPEGSRSATIVMGGTSGSDEDPSSQTRPGMTQRELMSLVGSVTVEPLDSGGWEYIADGVTYTFEPQIIDRSFRLTGCGTDQPDRLTQLQVQVGDTLDEALDALGMTPLGDGYYTCSLEGYLNARVNEFDNGTEASRGKEILITFPSIWMAARLDADDQVTSIGWYQAPVHTVMKDRTSFRITDSNLVTANGVTPGMVWSEVATRTGADAVSEGEDFSVNGTEYRFDRRSDGQYHLAWMVVTEGPLPLAANLSVGDSLETVLKVLDITDLDPADPAFPIYGAEYGQPGYAAFAYGPDNALRLEALTESGAQVSVTFGPDNRIVQADVVDPVARTEGELWYRVDDTTDYGILSESVLNTAAVDDGFPDLRGIVLALGNRGGVILWDTVANGVQIMPCPPINTLGSLDYVGNGRFVLQGDEGQSCTFTYNPETGQLDTERSGG